MKIETKITPEQIANLMVSFVESGMSNFWCGGLFHVKGVEAVTQGPWYSDPKFWAGDFRVRVKEISDEGDDVIDFTVGPAEFTRGLQALADKMPQVIADILTENDDAETADLVMQFVCFGEERYA